MKKPTHPATALLAIAVGLWVLFAIAGVPWSAVSNLDLPQQERLQMVSTGLKSAFTGAIPVAVVVWVLWMIASYYWRRVNQQA